MSKVIYTHFNVGRGHATIAGKLNPHNYEFEYSVSFCAPNDKFCKKTGRNIALHRLQSSMADRFQGVVGASADDNYAELCLKALLNHLPTMPLTWYNFFDHGVDGVEIRGKKRK